MQTFTRTSLLAIAALVAVVFLINDTPAKAQGGIVCEFGSTVYRRCCSQSYRLHPSLGPRARADDIQACENRGGSESRRQSDERSDRNAERARSRSESLTRRVDCGSGGCPDGCAGDEIAIGAFCAVGEFPTPNGDRDVACASNAGQQRPTMLICTKAGR